MSQGVEVVGAWSW